MNVSWNDAQEYVAWLSRRTGKTYRLLTEAEWEYAARGGEQTAFSWGDEIGENNANCKDCGSKWDAEQTAPVGSFAANKFGLHDMHGNVFEWVQNCWQPSLEDNLANEGSGRIDESECRDRSIRGGSWLSPPENVRAASRIFDSNVYRVNVVGIRVARMVAP